MKENTLNPGRFTEYSVEKNVIPVVACNIGNRQSILPTPSTTYETSDPCVV